MDCKKLLAAVLVLLSALTSCEKAATFEHTLRLGAEQYDLDYAKGTTPVVVWSDTDWTVAFDQPAPWAGLDRLQGSGVGQVKFSWTRNYGAQRSVTLVFTAGGETCSVRMVQASDPNYE